jgi:hypothetical protein
MRRGLRATPRPQIGLLSSANLATKEFAAAFRPATSSHGLGGGLSGRLCVCVGRTM